MNLDKKRLMCLTVGLFLGLNALIVAPHMLNEDKHRGPHRTYLAFEQHYAALVYKHQIAPVENPFMRSPRYMDSIFPGAKSMKEIVLKYPKKYYDFLCLSIGHGMKRLAVLFHVLLFFIFIIYNSIRKGRYQIDLFGKLFLLSLIGTIPYLLFSFPHIRYLAKYYPLVIILLLSFIENCKDDKTVLRSKWLIGVGVGINILIFLNSLKLLTSGIYWFPD